MSEEKKELETKPFTYADFVKSEGLTSAEAKATATANAYDTWLNNGFNFSKQNDWNTAYNNYNDWSNKGFSYDFNADALYQQYKDRYISQGKMAMADAMGQASAMTGGYGNSYAATVGNQAYQQSLDKLNDVIPELYQLAYDRHTQEGQNYLNMLGLLGSERDYEYGVWNDKLGQLSTDRGYYQGLADDAYNREYGEWYDGKTFAYGQYRDGIEDEQWAKNYLLQENADKRAAEEWAIKKATYESGNTSSSSSSSSNSSSSSSSSSSSTKTKPTYDSIKSDLNKYIKNGADKSEINNYLRQAYQSGYITQSQYNTLKSQFAPRGYTY